MSRRIGLSLKMLTMKKYTFLQQNKMFKYFIQKYKNVKINLKKVRPTFFQRQTILE